MTNEMIEKVQKAVNDHIGPLPYVCGFDYEMAEVAFRAAIEVLMEPTNDMVRASFAVTEKNPEISIYKAMLKAALGEQP